MYGYGYCAWVWTGVDSALFTIKAIPNIHAGFEKHLEKMSLDWSIWDLSYSVSDLLSTHPLQIHEVVHCKECTWVVIFSRSFWVNTITVTCRVRIMFLLSSWGQPPIMNHKALGEVNRLHLSRSLDPLCFTSNSTDAGLLNTMQWSLVSLINRSSFEAIKREGDSKSNTITQDLCKHGESCRPFPGKIFSPEASAPRQWLDPACLTAPVDLWWVCMLWLTLSAH